MTLPLNVAEKSKGDSRLYAIDILRALAALAVMVSHLPFNSRGVGDTSANFDIFPPAPFPEWMSYGRYGVHLFLVISGFCIHMRWARAGTVDTTVDFKAFWKRRLKRIYPPYLVALAASLTLLFGFYFISNGGLKGSPWNWFGYTAASLFLVDLLLLLTLSQNLNGASHRVGNGPFWSLALEEQLYMLYFPLLKLRRRFGWTVTFAFCACLTLVWRGIGLLAFETPPGFWNVVGPAFWLSWAFGAWAAEVSTGKVQLPFEIRGGHFFAATGLLIVLNQMLKPFTSLIFDQAVGLWSTVLILWLISRERVSTKPPSRVSLVLAQAGLWSYSVYLMHDLIFKASKQVLVDLGFSDPIVLILRFSSGLAAGYLLYRLIEKPSLIWAQRQPVPLVSDPISKAP